MSYFILISIVSVLWGAAEILRKLSANADSRLLSTAFNLGAFLAPFLWLVMAYVRKEVIVVNHKSVVLSTLGGVLVGIGCVVLFDILATNVSTSITIGLIPSETGLSR